MHSFIVAALAGLAIAAPRAEPQGLDWEEIDSVAIAPLVAAPVAQASPTVAYNPSTIIAAATGSVATDPATPGTKRSLVARDGTCAKQSTGSGPVPSPDTAAAFLADSDLAAAATNAPTPYGYSSVFTNAQASVSGVYLTYKTLTSYNTALCQSFCDQTSGCMGFNIYFERDPTLDPGVSSKGVTCYNPPSTTNIKCSLFGAPFAASDANNAGQWRDQFDLVIAGSNGYLKSGPPPATTDTGFTGPVELGGAINAPSNYIGAKVVSTAGWSFNPDTCAALCRAQTTYNRNHPAADGTYSPCNFFNMYVLSKNGVPQGLTCSMYSVAWGPSYGTNYGQYRGSDYYGVSDSYSYTLSPADSGTTSVAH